MAVSGTSRSERALAAAVVLAVITATFEGPMRLVLNIVGLDAMIFVRDILLVGSLLFYILSRAPGGTVPGSVGIFLVLACVHSFVSVVNLGTPIAAVYGIKMFIPVLCGFLVPQALFRPAPWLVKVFVLAWVATAIGAGLEKQGYDYPWVGFNVQLGGIDVAVGRDWQSGAVRRVGGFTRSSINLAVLMPLLSLVLWTAAQSRLLRLLIAAITLTVLVWTTQKGAILGYALALLAYILSSRASSTPLRCAAVVAVAAMIFAPTVLIQYPMPTDRGVFSFESLIERIEWMWPAAWAWIDRFPPLLGVGLGGIGGSQRFFAATDFNPADNLFIYLYANFGLAGAAYLLAVVWIAVSAPVKKYAVDSTVMVSLVFLLFYGLVISLVEDLVAGMWLGACLGWLMQLKDSVARAAPARTQRVLT